MFFYSLANNIMQALILWQQKLLSPAIKNHHPDVHFQASPPPRHGPVLG